MSLISQTVFFDRVCMIEPGAVQTPVLENPIEVFGALAVDESIDDIDRHHIAYILSVLNEGKKASPADIAEAIVTRCLDVDEPVFRHLLSEVHMEPVERAAKDLTGEAAVAVGREMLGVS